MAKTKKRISGVLLLLPFIMGALALFFVTRYALQYAVSETAFLSLLIQNDAQSGKTELSADGFVPGQTPQRLYAIPQIEYGSQWAILNVSWDGGAWAVKDVPVYLGADKTILKVAAGMSFGSSFPGEGGRTIISAHVTRHFAELEDTKEGAIVELSTLYGTYRYRVEEVQSFKGTERELISPSDADNKLILYTCYPRDNDGHRRTKRCALVCELVEGLEVQP